MSFHSLRTFFVGFLMGTADVIPGVSGGTIAFITGIYDTLITSLAHINKHLLSLIVGGQRKKARSYVNGGFLVQLFTGILVAIIVLAKTMTYLLEAYPIYVFAFFFGLIVASIIFIIGQIQQRRISTYMALVAGILIGYGATAETTMIGTNQASLVSIFFAGAIASAAMILPGISGSYILVLLGKYAYILETLSTWIDSVGTSLRSGNIGNIFNEKLVIIITFVGGVAVGLLGFSRILHRLLTHHRSFTLATLVGCMIGALHIIWPRSTTMSGVDRGITLLLTLIGAGLIYMLTHISSTKKTTS